ncbi:serine/threonine-protein kinase [Yinghuangia seranimata]|uniref:serine/threonine-protein kinase n=1 Tax=Yinghuangia seranimata TaxID=408067 RepID=UPI00248C2A3D|nr:serine/threonine-protein kinase [Yinghuangia seranimata]MDI2129078.1 protein kinase [Yinghuangia seranimata]
MTAPGVPPVSQPTFPSLAPDDPAEVGGYRLAARLGAGGMGRVYLAHTPGGRPLALKVVRPEYAHDPEFRVRFAQEVANARRIHGLYTAQVVDAGPDAELPWLATAYVPGPSLHHVLATHGPLPPRTVLLLMAGIAEALQEIHRAEVVHRDLKPANVLVAADGPRVIDFGIARAADAVALTQAGIRMGTPAFMAPEQALGRPAAPAADVFALGVLAAFTAGGAPPFGTRADTAQAYRLLHEQPDLTGVPPELHDILLSCMAKDAAARPTTAQVIAYARDHPALGGQLRFTDDWLPSRVNDEISRRSAVPGPARSGADPDAATRLVGEPGAATLRVPADAAADAAGERPDGLPRAARGRRKRRRIPVTATLFVLIVAAVGGIAGLLLLDELDPSADEPTSAHSPAAAPGAPGTTPPATSPGPSGAAQSPPGVPPTTAPSGPAYAELYADRVLTAPGDGYDFDIASGTVTPAESSTWAIGRNAEEFLIPADADAAVVPAGAAAPTPDECTAALDRGPTGVVTFQDAAAGRSFCVRSRAGRDLAVVRVLATSGDGPVKVALTAYRPRR